MSRKIIIRVGRPTILRCTKINVSRRYHQEDVMFQVHVLVGLKDILDPFD